MTPGLWPAIMRRRMLPRPALLVLIVGNAIVLLGQIWPEGAPPFARFVNIAVLAASLTAFALLWRSQHRA